MPARTGYEHHPDYWNTLLACSVGHHLNRNQPEDKLRDDYQQWLDSPACDAATRLALPPVPRKTKEKPAVSRGRPW